MNRWIALAAAAMATGLSACAPTLAQRGYVPETPDFASKVQAGIDTKATVTEKLGSPSTTAAFDPTIWYYVTELQATRAFLDPKVREREVVVVRFDPNDTVLEVQRFGLERGQIVSFTDAVTPTRGREFGILEQLLGNVGRSPAQIGAEEAGRENRR